MKRSVNPLGLYLRNGIWWTSWRFGGRRIRISLSTRIRDDATRLAMEARSHPEAYLAHEIDQYIAEYLRSKLDTSEIGENTAYMRERDLRNFITSASVVSTCDLTLGNLQRWFDTALQKVARSTAQQRMKHISLFCGWLKKQGKLAENPCAKVTLEKDTGRRRRMKWDRLPQKARTDFLAAEQVDTLISQAPTDEIRFALLAGFDAGLRIGEIIAARVRWITLNPGGTGHMEVQEEDGWEPKTRRGRMVPLTRRFAAFLAPYIGQRQPDAYVLLTIALPSSRRYCTRRERITLAPPPPRIPIAADLVTFFTAQGFPDLRTHAMRRTFASLRVSAGVDLFKVAKWLGDKVSTTEKHYGHLARVDDDVERVHRVANEG